MLREPLLFAVAILCATNVRGEHKPKDERFDPKGCEKPERELKGYVGVGYDELTGEFKSSPYEISFEKNVTTDDGCFFVPDEVTARNIFDFYAKSKETSRYSLAETSAAITYGLSVKSRDINALGSVRLSFNPAYETAKQFPREENTATFIYQANLIAFELHLEARRRIEPVLKSRLESMVLSYTKGFEQSARHKAETIIRDYGTKVVNHAYAGLMTSVFASRKFSSSEEVEKKKLIIKALAEALFHAGEPSAGGSVEGETVSRIKMHLDKTAVYPVGERLLPSSQKSVVSYTDYIKIPQEFEPITTIVDRANLTDNQIKIAKELLGGAIRTYVEHNTHKGCLEDATAANYNTSVNVDEGSCVRFTAFGGYFLTYVDEETGRYERSLNPVLDVNSCGDYANIKVNMMNNKHIIFCFSRDHNKIRNQKKAYFGGMYHPNDTLNRLTNAPGCPDGYQNHSLGPVGFDMFICLDVSRTAKDAYEVSEFIYRCDSALTPVCQMKNFKGIKLHTHNNDRCYIGACVFKGTIEFQQDFGPIPDLRQLPFTVMEDENAMNSTETNSTESVGQADNANDTNGSNDFFTENITLLIVLIVVIAVIVLAAVTFFVLRARRLSRAKGVAKPSKNSATGSTTSSSNMNKDTTTSQATVGDNDRKTARSGANRSAPNTPAAKTAGTTTGATPK